MTCLSPGEAQNFRNLWVPADCATMKLNTPLRLQENRVARIYQGGALIDAFLGKTVFCDSNTPENWIGSDTEALGPGYPGEGVAMVVTRDGSLRLDELLRTQADAWLGEAHIRRLGRKAGILTKELDSLIRLPIQAHPDRAFARAHLASPYGKTETWYVVGGRHVNGQPPHVYLGFTAQATPQRFRDAYERQDIGAMLEMLNRVEVRAGDFFVIPGGVPHAIGSGVFCIEVQEPTDFVFQLDKKTEHWDLTPQQVHMGLGDDRMFAAFAFDGPRGDDILRLLRSRDSGMPGEVDLLQGGYREFFGCTLLRVHGSREWKPHGFAVVIVMQGMGWLVGAEKIPCVRGDAFVWPYAAEQVRIVSEGEKPLTLFVATPPAFGIGP